MLFLEKMSLIYEANVYEPSSNDLHSYEISVGYPNIEKSPNSAPSPFPYPQHYFVSLTNGRSYALLRESEVLDQRSPKQQQV